MSEMVERVAKAMCDAEMGHGIFEAYKVHRDSYMTLARVSIEAMREPTEAMVDAANALDRVEAGLLMVATPNRAWEAMIDEALK